MVWESFWCLLVNSKRAVMCFLLRRDFHLLQSHLPNQGPSPSIAQFGWANSCRMSLGGYKLLPFKNDGGHWGPSMLQTFFGTLPQSCASTQSCLGAQWTIPSTSWLGFCSDMHTVDCGPLYRQVCAFPNNVESIEFTTSGLQSSCRTISRMINGNRCTWAQFRVS